MAILANQRPTPSIERVLHGMPGAYQAIVTARYQRLLPVVLLLMSPRDILERNRAWPGISPTDKGATSYLVTRNAALARDIIDSYAATTNEDGAELWKLFWAYCRYGPIGLIDALPTDLPPLVPDELQECADFHRLAKHPRSDAGLYIRELLDAYADSLGLQRLPPFVARYAWATDRKIDRWFINEGSDTGHVVKTTRRLNLNLAYPHQRWHIRTTPLPFEVLLARRHPQLITPWLCWCDDEQTNTLMGFRLTPTPPTPQDVLLTIRWSIWHFDAPWWKARGAPDELIVPAAFTFCEDDTRRALSYVRTTLRYIDPRDDDLCDDDLSGWPENVVAWLNAQAQRESIIDRQRWTIAEVHTHLLDLMHDAMQDGIFARATPSILAEHGVSLPWSTGIAAALLLPSAGTHQVRQGLVAPWQVPFDLSASELPEGKEVDIRYDPEDARSVYVICDGSRVARAPALAFEHRTTWMELVDNPNIFQ